jgi:hypothetical protein
MYKLTHIRVKVSSLTKLHSRVKVLEFEQLAVSPYVHYKFALQICIIRAHICKKFHSSWLNLLKSWELTRVLKT